MQFEEFQTAVPQALRTWRNLTDTADDPLAQLLIVQQVQTNASGSTSATYQVLRSGIQQLQEQDPISAQILTARFVDGQTILMTANKLNLSEDQVKRRQREAIRTLTQLLWGQETAVRQNHLHTLQAQLPPPTYTNLFGSQNHLNELTGYLTQPDAPGVIAIVGIGGIGKTALADQVVRAILPRLIFQQVVWLRVSPDNTQSDLPPEMILGKIVNDLAEQLCPQTAPSGNGRIACLRQIFKTRPTLVVVDNLETEANLTILLDALNDWAIPSKFLLTTRVRLPAASVAYSLVLDELPLPSAADLITTQAESLNLTDLVRAPDSVVRQIYAVTGGNPLALKLVVGLTAVLPPPANPYRSHGCPN